MCIEILDGKRRVQMKIAMLLNFLFQIKMVEPLPQLVS